MALDVLDIVQLGCKRVVDVDDHDLPVGLFFVEERHDAEDFDLLDGAGGGDELADLADVEGVVVTFCFGLRVNAVGVFPCLVFVSLSRAGYGECAAGKTTLTYLREGAIVPQIAFVWEAVADETKLAFLDVLLDWVEGLFLRDLKPMLMTFAPEKFC